MKKREKIEPESAALSAWHVKGSLKGCQPYSKMWLAGKGYGSLPQPAYLVLLSGWVQLPTLLGRQECAKLREP